MYPSHFISSAQINLISVLNEYVQMRDLAGQDTITKGNSIMNVFFSIASLSSSHCRQYIKYYNSYLCFQIKTKALF